MKNKILLFSVLLIFILSTFSFANGLENRKTQILSPGVTLDEITRLTANGWLYIDMIKIDLKNEYAKIDVIGSENGVSSLSTTKNMAKYANAVAALNADYFAKRPNTSNKGQSIGFWGSDGKVLQSSADENINSNTMASFILDNKNNIIYDYLKDEISLKCPNGSTIYVADINKYLPLEAPCCIFTSDWGEKSIGNSEGKEMIELVVKNNKIVEIRNNQEGIDIPEDGYVVSAYGNYGTQLLENFSVGSKISYDIKINLDLDKLQFAVSGGTILVKDGEISKVTHTIYGKHEFSAIGSSKDGQTVYLVAVTRVNGNTFGITQSELAQIIKDLGIYNAINLDGGGSTTLVAKYLGEDTIKSINIDDGNYLRPVINSIGVFSLAPKTELSNLILALESTNIFRDNYTDFSIKGYDSNYNYIEIDKDDVKLTFSNSNAKYDNSKILGLKEGNVIVTATYKGVKTTANLKVLGDVYSLDISPKTANVKKGGTQFFTLIGTDKNGYSAPINNKLVNWNIDGTGTISDNGLYTATSSGTAIISASIDKAKSFVKVGVMNNIEQIYDDFENLKGKFSSYPNTINGNVKLNSSSSKTGNNCLKITYDFSTNDTVKGAYYDYSTALKMPDNISEISLWVYNPIKNDNSLKSQYKDKNGNTRISILCDKLDFTGWKQVKFENANLIKSIVSIYVAQSNNSNNESSYVLIDTLNVKYYGYVNDNFVIPNNIVGNDELNKDIQDSEFTLSLVEQIEQPNTLFDKIKNNKLINNFNTNSDLVIFTKGTQNTQYISDLTTKYISSKLYTKINYNQFTIITIDVSSSGIANTNFSQWESLIDDLDNTKKNVLIILNNSLDTFSDDLEKDFLLNKLISKSEETSNRYWIIQNGKTTNNVNYNRIKILTIGNSSVDNSNINNVIDNYKYINIYLKSDDIYYDIKNIFE